MRTHFSGLARRDFLALLGSAALPLATAAPKAGGKELRGIFPIAQSPFTSANRLDLDSLAKEVRFVDRAGGHGFVWPQLASEYSTLSESERISGAEAVAAAGRGLRAAIVIGVQGPDLASATRYARHAEKIGADAIISLPPDKHDPEAVLEYYAAIGKACHLPLFAQAVGDMSVEFLARMSKAIPTLAFVKDEAGPSPLSRIAPLHEQSGGKLGVFTGGHGITLLDELQRGSSGSMPAASFVDLYATVWNLWHSGKQTEAMDLFGKTLLFITEVQVYGVQSLKYILHERGVFPGYSTRIKDAKAPLDDNAKRLLRQMLDFAKPYLKA